MEDDAFAYMCDAIVALAGRVDGLLLDLHGAMTTKTYDDGEGELLRRIRQHCPELPIAISLDMHANITEQMVSNCDVLTGLPHLSAYRYGQHSTTRRQSFFRYAKWPS